jgi:hypothetical protein
VLDLVIVFGITYLHLANRSYRRYVVAKRLNDLELSQFFLLIQAHLRHFKVSVFTSCDHKMFSIYQLD